MEARCKVLKTPISSGVKYFGKIKRTVSAPIPTPIKPARLALILCLAIIPIAISVSPPDSRFYPVHFVQLTHQESQPKTAESLLA